MKTLWKLCLTCAALWLCSPPLEARPKPTPYTGCQRNDSIGYTDAWIEPLGADSCEVNLTIAITHKTVRRGESVQIDFHLVSDPDRPGEQRAEELTSFTLTAGASANRRADREARLRGEQREPDVEGELGRKKPLLLAYSCGFVRESWMTEGEPLLVVSQQITKRKRTCVMEPLTIPVHIVRPADESPDPTEPLFEIL